MISSRDQMCDGGNRTLRWSQFCDGIVDCHDRSDEEGRFCKHCLNNLYSCPPKDDIRCDLACKMLQYVPCQTIQDRRACHHLRHDYGNYSPYQLLRDLNFYVAVAIATIVILLILTGIFLLTKYLIRVHRRRTVRASAKTLDLVSAPPRSPPSYSLLSQHAMDRDGPSSHIYEQCYEPPSYDTAHKYPLTRKYYEHAL